MMYCNQCGAKCEALMLHANKTLLCCAACAKGEQGKPAETSVAVTEKPTADNTKDTAKSANILDYLIAEIHRSFTVCADNAFGDGRINQDERIGLSSAISDALDAFNTSIDAKNFASLRQRPLYEAIAMEKTTFVDTPWEKPSLEANAYCSVCLVDENLAGAEKTKENCHLPVRSTPGGPVNQGALRNAASRLGGTKMSDESKAKAKAKLISLMHAAGMDTSLEKYAEPATDGTFEYVADVLKTNTEARITVGVVYPAQPLGWKDTQNDWVSEPEIEKMAHRFMIESQNYDVNHRVFDLSKTDAVVVESYIAPTDFTIGDKQVSKGSWVVATHYPSDRVWNQVKAGEIKSYSIRGKAKRRPIKQPM